ncbi:MAG: FHA domain-containing protein [Atopobiaceae bacterium]|nr:FHA domain-containing protein [Atopobiaceae bacterium]
MTQTLLITMRAQDACRTFSFDESTQSVLWLTPWEGRSTRSSGVCLESIEGALELRTSDGWMITMAEGQAVRMTHVPISAAHECIFVLERDAEVMTLHVRVVGQGAKTFAKQRFLRDVEFEIGRGDRCEMCYRNGFVSVHHARMSVRDGAFAIMDLQSANGTYVNERRLPHRQPYRLIPGDVVQIVDLIFAVGSGFVSINSPDGLFLRKSLGMEPLVHSKTFVDGAASEVECEHALFYPAPRLTKSIHPLRLVVDGPPARQDERQQPALMQMGPSFLMGMTSVLMAVSGIARVVGGDDLLAVAPSIGMAVAMIGGSFVWPLISRSHLRKRRWRGETIRTQAYMSYLDGIENAIAAEVEEQGQVLRDTRPAVSELLERAEALSPLLMNRTSAHEDFLALRVGLGNEKAKADIGWPERRFSLSRDPMIDKVGELAGTPPLLRDVPLAFDLAHHFVAGVLGERALVWEFVRGLIVQACALYSYTDLKVVLLASEEERTEWDFLTSLGHFYGREDGRRLVALTFAGMVQLDLYLEHELEGRADVQADVLGDYGCYYLVICAHAALYERSEAVGQLACLRQNLGFSLVFLGHDLSDLPRECTYLVDLTPTDNLGAGASEMRGGWLEGRRKARMFERSDVSGTLVSFDPDVYVCASEARAFALSMARAHLDVPGQRVGIPRAVGFLEMFEAGCVTHLNVGKRWADNDASRTLQVQVGVGPQGDPAYLDLHESVHGPHGLIAGTTGSGKSEFIITYVLSLSVCFAPDEVAFVLIDYKGGGLAGAFENERHHLPHLAGTITNLDGSAIRRSLISIQSELRRRQRLFNEARERTGESTMDIYRYLSAYRQGLLEDPLPHLFIVADEFAELKQQEPDFMNELVSAARIGRSLGIHLILATQKPSGVVDDQIWSNARFKVALKVSDVADSREMIRREDAAEIDRPGRYYLLVGYNESFSEGQAAYAGGPYVPSDHFVRRREQAVELIDAQGQLIAAQRPRIQKKRGDVSELDAVLSKLEETANALGVRARRLWLDPLSASITLDDLAERYGGLSREGLTCVVGELDDPRHQEQRRYEVDLVRVGNIMLYGSQNSDVDGLLRTIIVSLTLAHTADELWVYAIDLGAGELAPLRVLPQVGGVVTAGDDERTNNLFRLLEEEVERRRDSAAGWSAGDDPRIVVGIANLAAFYERFEALEDRLCALTRDASRYGIHFLVTSPTVGTPRLRLRANFGFALPTILNDPSDYSMLLGSLEGMPVPQRARGGIVKDGKHVLEFQGACLGPNPMEERRWIKQFAGRVGTDTATRARAIPVLPKLVNARAMEVPAHALLMPVGYSRSCVAPVYFDLAKSRVMLVLGNDIDDIARYLRGLREACALRQDVTYRFVDPQRVLGDVQDDNVLQEDEPVCAFVQSLDQGGADARIVVFTSIVQTMSALPAREGELLEEFLSEERNAHAHALVVATELWRAKSIYQDWYRVVTAYGNGVWVGGGFAEQTAFGFARSLPEYRRPAARSDGFLVMRGQVESVRLLEAT